MNYNVQLTADSVVKIGKEYRSANKITVSVKSTEDTKGLPIRVTVRVGCGSKESDLLASQNDWVKITCRQANGEPDEMSPNPLVNEKEWDTGMFGISLPASICLEDFVSNTPPGAAEITITGHDTAGRLLFTEVRKIAKDLEKRSEPAIRYFLVNPNYILHAGQTEITVSFLATGCDRMVLFKNNEAIRFWDNKNDVITGTVQDKPSITSVYRLKVYGDNSKQEPITSPDRFVQVMSSGWNRIALPLGSPVRLFAANDFSGSGTERLYGIFKDDQGNYTLYSSATGVDGWRREPGNVPPQMATSPGVLYNNKLWLIGGSSVDPGNCNNEVWSYDKDGWRNRSDEKAPPWTERMGHACIVFPRMHDGKVEEEIWVFGGYNNGEVFRDLWRGRENGAGTLVWEIINSECPWDGRLNHAAAAVRDWQDNPQVWLYGGAHKPQMTENLDDLWTTHDGETWIKKEMEESDSAIVSAPGSPLGSALVVYRAGTSSGIAKQTESREVDRIFLLGSFQEWAADKAGQKRLGNRISSFIFEWQWGHKVWEVQPVFEGWQQFQGDSFYMQAIAFNRFLFVWSLRSEIDAALKLNILVPL